MSWAPACDFVYFLRCLSVILQDFDVAIIIADRLAIYFSVAKLLNFLVEIIGLDF